jgi:hypothetical protein
MMRYIVATPVPGDGAKYTSMPNGMAISTIADRGRARRRFAGHGFNWAWAILWRACTSTIVAEPCAAPSWWYGAWDKKNIDWWWGEGDEFFVDGEQFPSPLAPAPKIMLRYPRPTPFPVFESAYAAQSCVPIDGNGETSVRVHISTTYRSSTASKPASKVPNPMSGATGISVNMTWWFIGINCKVKEVSCQHSRTHAIDNRYEDDTITIRPHQGGGMGYDCVCFSDGTKAPGSAVGFCVGIKLLIGEAALLPVVLHLIELSERNQGTSFATFSRLHIKQLLELGILERGTAAHGESGFSQRITRSESPKQHVRHHFRQSGVRQVFPRESLRKQESGSLTNPTVSQSFSSMGQPLFEKLQLSS